MIPKECKRLIEVDFPIAEVSKQAAREKSIRHGHPSTLHLWWARRPLASSRAVLMGLLLPDPGDENCPEEFKTKARELLPIVVGPVGGTDEELRAKLLRFIADFSNWDHSTHPAYLEVARGLIKAANEAPPFVVDPFAGGGSIPLETLRIGCDAFASDLNPVACLILKVLLEDIPRHGRKLIDELSRAGAAIKAEAEKQLAEFYPVDPDGSKPVSYLWARTVNCETPGCGAEIPLVRSFWLSKRSEHKWALRYTVMKHDEKAPRIILEVFQPTSDDQVPLGLVSQAKARCPCCGSVLPSDRLRSQLTARRGGTNTIIDDQGSRVSGAMLLAVVTSNKNGAGRFYRLPAQRDYTAIRKANEHLNHIKDEQIIDGLTAMPNEQFHSVRPSPNARGLSAVTRYGMNKFSDLYLARQMLSLLTFSKLINKSEALNQGTTSPGPLANLLALTLSRVADYCSSESRWDATQQRNVNSFGRQALPMLWDFAELVPTANCVGSWDSMLRGILRVIDSVSVVQSTAQVENADATKNPLPDDTSDVWFTDPPYYDSVPYADLSDFFYVWLKRILPNREILKNRFEPGSQLTPKLKEAVWNRAYKVEGKEKDPEFFERAITNSFIEARRFSKDSGVGCVVFAHKSTEGWEALISGLVNAGWNVTASWPIATEQAQRLVARDSAALATSVHLICRPRSGSHKIGDWAMVYDGMKNKVADWIERLSVEGIHGADLVFACIGPALEVYSRYEKVVDANDREIPLGGNPSATEPYERGYLAYIWEVVGRTALEQVLGTAEAKARNGAAGVLEEDSRLTALFLWTLMSSASETGNGENTNEEEANQEAEDEEEETKPGKKKAGYALVFDVVRRFAQPLGIDLDKWKGRIIDIEKGTVRLIPLKERVRQLFGEDSFSKIAAKMEKAESDKVQLVLFPDEESPEIIAPKRTSRTRTLGSAQEQKPREATTLDRVHAAMLLQASGQAGALKALVKSEQERGSDFVRLANALSALYPKKSEEKRLLDAMLLTVPKR